MKSKTKEEDWLKSLLESREKRAAKILGLGRRNAGVVVALTVNWPGPDKDTPQAGLVHRAGIASLKKSFSGRIVYEERASLFTGNEAYFIIAGEAGAVKAQTCEIENVHPLGRLFDIDVLGEGLAPLSRTALGYPQRRCMVCGGETIVCRRQNRHSQDELAACLDAMIEKWQHAREGT